MQVVRKNAPERIIILIAGTTLGVGLTKADSVSIHYYLGGLYVVIAIIPLIIQRKFTVPLITALIGVYVMSTNWVGALSRPIIVFSQSLERGFWSNAIFQFADYIKVLAQPTPTLLAIALVFAGVILLQGVKGKSFRIALGICGLAVPCALSFVGIPFAMVEEHTLLWRHIWFALPALLRSEMAALRQIDPSIEEAQYFRTGCKYTFRKVTLPLILPALFAGLIFSFTRHMTSLSAIIFLVSARWRIVTASILSEWEQGGVSIAAAYSTVIIIFVMIAIVVLNLIVNKLFKGRGSVDMSQGF
jgi:iron(III) transport system permease protein